MKRRVVSMIAALALCLSLCPTWALAADTEPDTGLCAHHWVHTEECGYTQPELGRDCTHAHDESCYMTETQCVHRHEAGCYPEPDPDSEADPSLEELEPSLCGHMCSEASGCVTQALVCRHVHDELCGYAPESAGTPCAFDCRVCPVQDLIGALPDSVTPENRGQVEDQLNAILALYGELDSGEQELVDLADCLDLQAQLSAANAPMLTASTASKPMTVTVTADAVRDASFGTASAVKHDLGGHTVTITAAKKNNGYNVDPGGALWLVGGGTLKSEGAAGISVKSGGALYIEDDALTIQGATYGLEIESGATVKLSGGTFIGNIQAISAADYDDLLLDGYGFFNPVSKEPIDATKMASEQNVIVKLAPKITWEDPSPVSVNYGQSVAESPDFPNVNITPAVNASVEYFYKVKAGENDDGTDISTYTKGLPTEAGTYFIQARLPETDDYYTVYSEPLELKIVQIAVTMTPPAAKHPVYNRASQELVTAGTVNDGAVIEYSSDGTNFSTDIPTGIDAGEYNVWYRVVSAGNYTEVAPVPVFDVKIEPKEIEPKVEVYPAQFEYTGSKKEPQITVKDGEVMIPDSQYTIAWDNDLTSAGTHTATITAISGKNYTFRSGPVTAQVTISEAIQGALSITGNPGTVHYGDIVTTLNTEGGTANGEVTWSVTAGNDIADIEMKTGKLTIKGVGSITVKAVRDVDNYGQVEATCNIIAEPKPVTAAVTAGDKPYDGESTATVTAKVDDSDLVSSGDGPITITGLTGTFDDVNVGANKRVTLNSSMPTVSGNGKDKYNISYPAAVTASITAKSLTDPTITLSGSDLHQKADGTYYYEFDGTEKRPDVTVMDGTEEIPASNYTVSYSNNKKAGTNAAVTVTAKDGGNYTFDSKTTTFEIRRVGATLTRSPEARRDLTYTGQPQELVTVGAADGGHIEYSLGTSSTYGESIPVGTEAGTYTVYYKVVGDGNHLGSDASKPWSVSVTIQPKEITPNIELSSGSFVYSGSAHTPSVTVKDGTETIGTPNVTDNGGEFTVSYRNNINAGTATVVISNANGGNYIVNGEKTFTITKAPPAVKAPTAKPNLQYNGTAQELVTAGSSDHGTVVYSLDESGPYTTAIPTGMEVKNGYKVYYKVLGDDNHSDSGPDSVSASITINTVTDPAITLSSNKLRYTGSEEKPTITVWDNNSDLIAEHEYMVTITKKGETTPVAPVDVGTYTIKISGAVGSNYSIAGNVTRDFEIVPADQETISITGTRGEVYYGDEIQLGTTGGTGSGTVEWTVTGGTQTSITKQGGLLIVKDINTPITVTAKRTSANYGTVSATWEFTAKRKPVTAVLTGVDKTFDGDTVAYINAEVKASDLVFGDQITISSMTGTFADKNVGTNKVVAVNRNSGVVTGDDNYEITYPATTTASITPAVAAAAAPTGKNLIYRAGEEQALIEENGGNAAGGTMVYSLDGANYSPNIPTAMNAGTYNVWYKAQGDGNHTDSAAASISVAIAKQSVTPAVELSPPSAPYDGSVKRPEVIVRDSDRHEIPKSEYEVVYEIGTNWIDAGEHEVTVKNVSGGNYVIQEAAKYFIITQSEQGPLTIIGQPGAVYFGGSGFTLSATGGSGNGSITWESSDTAVAEIDANSGLVTIKSVGSTVITAKREASLNYAGSTATWTLTVNPKPVTVTITVAPGSYVYNAAAKTPAVTVMADGTTELTRDTDYTVEYSNNANAGTATVTVKAKGNYAFNNGTANFEIEQATPSVTWPTASAITSGQQLNESRLNNGGSDVPGTFAWVNRDMTLNEVGQSEQNVTFIPADTANYKTLTTTISVTVKSSTPDTSTGAGAGNGSIETPTSTPSTPAANAPGASSTTTSPMQTNVQNGTAKTKVSAAAANTLVQEAKANQSETVVIKPEITGEVTKTEVSIPAATMNQLKSATSADVTVSTPVADVTIPNEALATLASAGGNVSVVAEQADDGSVTVTLTAGGQDMGSVPGGLTVAVPVETTTPGTVAVLVHEDGTRETIRRSVAGDGVVNIPLDGSAKVEIVDNSKEFADIAPTDWESDAVAFASAHELFNGTSEGTFSPNQPMSRAMVATVLYNLEGRPEQSVTSDFSDVNDGDWYAESVSWAKAKGITDGSSESQFDPNGSVTREQFAVMLWRYAGQPASGGQALSFTDADQVSEYAQEAMRWATANGILNGYGNGKLDPDGKATRAQAAQMLKNFMENT